MTPTEQTPSESAPKHVEPHKQRKYMEPYAGWLENNPHPLEGDDAKAFNEERKKNERKKVPSSERSHSPTEQPGDSANKFNEAKWRIEYSKYSTYCNIIDADGYVGTVQGREKAELIAKAPEMAAEIERLKSQLKDYCNDCQHPSVNERQAAELSKLRQENEAKRSDLTDKLEEAVHHMDNGHTAQATTLIYEVIGELEPKGE